MNRDLKLVASYASLSSAANVRAAAERLLKRPRRIPKAGPSRKAEKRSTRVERNARMAEIREKVFARSGSACQVPGCYLMANHLHHTISGPLRRAREAVETTLALCAGHHAMVHAGDLGILRDLATYAMEHEMPEAARALARRIAKIQDTREATASQRRGA